MIVTGIPYTTQIDLIQTRNYRDTQTHTSDTNTSAGCYTYICDGMMWLSDAIEVSSLEDFRTNGN